MGVLPMLVLAWYFEKLVVVFPVIDIYKPDVVEGIQGDVYMCIKNELKFYI